MLSLLTTHIAHLGPEGTYSDIAAIAYTQWLQAEYGVATNRQAFPSIQQALQSTVDGLSHYSVVPVENSIQGSVTVTLDTLWQLEKLYIHHALILPIAHRLLSASTHLSHIQRVYSHPQAIAQCQQWLTQNLPTAEIVPTRSTTEALSHLNQEKSSAGIASSRASQLYQIPILVEAINDHADNCTKFVSISLEPSTVGTRTSLAFSLPVNAPGALLKPLQIFSTLNINLSRIESRPTKRSLGEYLFFLDLEASLADPQTQLALDTLKACTETLKVFGSYSVISALSKAES